MLGSSLGHFRDNYIFCSVESESPSAAYETITTEVDMFLKHLSLSQVRVSTSKPLFIQSDDGTLFPVPRYLALVRVTCYNLEALRKDIQDTQQYQCIVDQRLERALEYFEHALLLFEKRGEIADFLSRHNTQLISSIFLNLWKALSAVVGDPSKPEDSDYQKRYKKFGLDYDFFRDKIEKVRDLRNHYDVTHYALSQDTLKEIEENFGEAKEIVGKVLQQHRQYLLKEIGSSQADSAT